MATEDEVAKGWRCCSPVFVPDHPPPSLFVHFVSLHMTHTQEQINHVPRLRAVWGQVKRLKIPPSGINRVTQTVCTMCSHVSNIIGWICFVCFCVLKMAVSHPVLYPARALPPPSQRAPVWTSASVSRRWSVWKNTRTSGYLWAPSENLCASLRFIFASAHIHTQKNKQTLEEMQFLKRL